MLKVFVLAGVMAFLASDCAGPVFAAQTKSLEELIKEREVLKGAVGALQKSFEANQAEFQKLDAVKKHSEKQAEINKAYGDLDVKIRALDSQIADKVSAGQKK